MTYDYDVIVIGLGPAGMAVAIMASEMGLKVCAIEKDHVGGECMNVGCIPSKALLRMAKYRHAPQKFPLYELRSTPQPEPLQTFKKIQEHLDYVREKKTMGMFAKVEMVYRQGAAQFVDGHTLQVGDKHYCGQRIYLCVGTRPQVPDFEGLKDIDYLTNETLFSLEAVPESLIVLGSGAIACEMAQAFARLGSKVTMIMRGPGLMWREDKQAMEILEKTFAEEGITLLRKQNPVRFEKRDGSVVMHTDQDAQVTAAKILLAAGRVMDYSSLHPERAGILLNKDGSFTVNKYLQTNRSHIYAVGDCNGYAQLSHAAMHQGMLALMNSMMPRPLKRDFKKFAVPATVFTEPQFSQVGLSEKELQERGIGYEVITVKYSDYGAAIAEAVDAGFVKVFAGRTGRIYGAVIIGEGSGEMINEWALALQKKLRLTDIMMLQHSFPTMGFLSKRAAETWMMNRMKSAWLKKIAGFFYRY